MRTSSTAFFVAFAITASADAAPSQERFPVEIGLTGDDVLSQNLDAALGAALDSDAELRPAVKGDDKRLFITSDSNVGWDTLGGRKVAIYTVYLAGGTYRSGPMTGVCYAGSLSKCAKDILRRMRKVMALGVFGER